MGGELGGLLGHPELRQLQLSEMGGDHAGSLVRPVSGVEKAVQSSTHRPGRGRNRRDAGIPVEGVTGRPVRQREIVTYGPAWKESQSPTVPSGQWTRTSARRAEPSPKWVGPSCPPAWPPPTTTSRSIR